MRRLETGEVAFGAGEVVRIQTALFIAEEYWKEALPKGPHASPWPKLAEQEHAKHQALRLKLEAL